MYMVSFTIGLIIVISSIFLMRNELNRAVKKQEQILEQSKLYKEGDLFNLLEALQVSIDEMNRAFYEIANDLEGKYSIHEKEINDLTQLINDMKTINASKVDKVFEPNGGSHTESLKDIQSNLSKMKQQFDQKSRDLNSNKVSNNKGRNYETSEWLNNESDTDFDLMDVPITESNKTNGKKSIDRDELETIDKIILLRSQGKSLTQIAKELGIGMGEIQLLLSLKK